MTSGWIPVAVLLLFAIALVTGQVDANLPDDIKASPPHLSKASMMLVVNGALVERPDVFPTALDSVLALPAEIEQAFDAKSIFSPGMRKPAIKSW